VASSPTAWRVIDAIKPEQLTVLREARRRAREQAWARGATPECIRRAAGCRFEERGDRCPQAQRNADRILDGSAQEREEETRSAYPSQAAIVRAMRPEVARAVGRTRPGRLARAPRAPATARGARARLATARPSRPP
jgi:hypothetical protein